jgi:GTPase SAR1 family protein
MTNKKINNTTIQSKGFQELLTQNILESISFNNVSFDTIKIIDVMITNTVFYNCTFNNIYFHRSILQHCRFWKCSFNNVILYDTKINSCEIVNSRVIRSHIRKSDLRDSSFLYLNIKSNIEISSFYGINLFNCDTQGSAFTNNKYSNIYINKEKYISKYFNSSHNYSDIENKINDFNIGVIGAPMVGKTSILSNMKGNIQSGSLYRQDIGNFGHSMVHLDGYINNKKIHFVTNPGPGLSEHLRILQILIQADIILYVYSMDSRKETDQFDYFNRQIIPYIYTLKKTWENVPWVLILNKIDLADSINSLRSFNSSKERKYIQDLISKEIPAIQSIAMKNIGTLDIIQAVTSLIDRPTGTTGKVK